MFQNLSKSRKEMEEFSAALESLINGQEPDLDRISEIVELAERQDKELF